MACFFIQMDELSLTGLSFDEFKRRMGDLLLKEFDEAADEVLICVGTHRLIEVDSGHTRDEIQEYTCQLCGSLLQEMLTEAEHARGGPPGGVVSRAEG